MISKEMRKRRRGREEKRKEKRKWEEKKKKKRRRRDQNRTEERGRDERGPPSIYLSLIFTFPLCFFLTLSVTPFFSFLSFQPFLGLSIGK